MEGASGHTEARHDRRVGVLVRVYRCTGLGQWNSAIPEYHTALRRCHNDSWSVLLTAQKIYAVIALPSVILKLQLIILTVTCHHAVALHRREERGRGELNPQAVRAFAERRCCFSDEINSRMWLLRAEIDNASYALAQLDD
jgi:hypothetical protein